MNSFHFRLLLAVFTMALARAEEIREIPLALKSFAEVSGATLLLKDVVESNAAIDPLSPDMPLGISPALGRQFMLHRTDIDVLLKRNYSQLSFKWTGAEQCTVSRPANEVTERQVVPMLEEALRKFVGGEGEIHVLQLVNYSPLLIPRQNSFTEIELVSPNTNTRFGQASLNVENDSLPFTRHNIRFEWEWKRPVWVARESLMSGPLQPDSFVMETRNVLSLSGEPYIAESLPTDLVLERSILRGEPLLHSNIKNAIAVTRGSSIDACVRTGALLVSMKGLALENGSVGQTIRLQNPTSGKELYGKVIHENTVEIIP